MSILDGELRRMESHFVRIYRPAGREQVGVARLLVDPMQPTGGVTLEPNRQLAEGEYVLATMSGAREWHVVLQRAEGKTMAVFDFPVGVTR